MEYIVALPNIFRESHVESTEEKNEKSTDARLIDDSENMKPENTNSQHSDLIQLTTPQAETTISSPLEITGQARGNWYFEGSFPVILTDWDGRIIAEGSAEAQGEWMTTEFVPFTAQLTFDTPSYGDRGSLILQKANPSGLPQNDAALEITIYFQN